MGGELFKMITGTDITHVPYKGAAPALADLIVGRVQINFASLPSVIGYVRSGKVRALAVTSLKRSQAVPDLPTLSESGLPGFELGAWQGMFATVGTPRPIIDKLHRETVKVMYSPDVLKRLADEGAEPVANTPEEFTQWLRGEIANWTKVIKTVGGKVD